MRCLCYYKSHTAHHQFSKEVSMTLKATVFCSLYSFDAEGYAEAQRDGSFNSLEVTPSTLPYVVKSALETADKLGYEVCVRVETDTQVVFYSKDNPETGYLCPVVPLKTSSATKSLRDIKALLDDADAMATKYPSTDLSGLYLDIERQLEAWHATVVDYDISTLDDINANDAEFFILESNAWYPVQSGSVGAHNTLLWAAKMESQVDSGSTRFGAWAEAVDGEPAINITLDDLREIDSRFLA